MGKISERFNHTQITNGYCLICGNYGTLSIDHVPPKGSITVTKIEQRHICEILGKREQSFKGVKSTNGSKFRTICQNCNSKILGHNDSEVARVSKEITDKIRIYFQAKSFYDAISVEIDAIMYARAMIGHILSATSVKECNRTIQSNAYFSPLQEFVLGNDDALNNSHDIYYWFYPSNRHISAKYVQFYNEGHSVGLSILSFYPLAFLVTLKNKGIYPAHSQKFDLKMSKLILNLSTHNIQYSNFPFVPLNEKSFYMLMNCQAIISYPIGN